MLKPSKPTANNPGSKKGVMNIMAIKQHFPFVSHDTKGVFGAVIPYDVQDGDDIINVGIGFTDLGQVYYLKYDDCDLPLDASTALAWLDINIKKSKSEISEVVQFEDTHVFATIKNGKVSIIEEQNIFDDEDLPAVISLIEEKAKYLELLIDEEYEVTDPAELSQMDK